MDVVEGEMMCGCGWRIPTEVRGRVLCRCGERWIVRKDVYGVHIWSSA
jgi:hypothetical protein